MKLELVETGMIFVAGIVGMGCATAIVQEWIKHRRPKTDSRELTGKLDELAERMARIENATDAVAIEVERISEGQRFTTKLLAERGERAGQLADRGRPGSTTPH